MSRLPILFVALLCCCPDGIFASPVTVPAVEQNTTNPEIVGLQTLAEQHYMHSMISDLLTKVLIDPFKQIVTAMALYLEIFSEASGARTFTVTPNKSSEANDKRQQLIAIAGTNLWLNLTTMERLNDIFLNASFAVVPILDDIQTDALPSLIADMFEKIDCALTRDSSLATLYSEEKLKAENQTVPVLAGGTGNPDTTYEKYPRFRAFIVRRQILEYVNGYNNVNDTVKFSRHVLSRAVFQLAKGATGQRMQAIFDEAVQATVDKIDPTVRIEDPSSTIDRILFSVLEEKFKTNFNDQFEQIRAGLVKKYST